MIEYTVHRRLLHIGLSSRRVSMLIPVHRQKRLQWACEHQNWTMEQWKKLAWSDELCFFCLLFFFYIMWMAGCVCVVYLGKR